MTLKNKTDITVHHRMGCHPLTSQWIEDNFGLDVESIYINSLIYLDLRKWSRDVFDLEDHQVQLKRGLMGYVYGINIFVLRGQKEHLTKVIFKDKTVKTLCNDHGWQEGIGCEENECIVREVHDA